MEQHRGWNCRWILRWNSCGWCPRRRCGSAAEIPSFPRWRMERLPFAGALRASRTILWVPVEKTAFSGFDRRKEPRIRMRESASKTGGIGWMMWDGMVEPPFCGLLLSIIINTEINFRTLIWLHLVHGHDTHEPALIIP